MWWVVLLGGGAWAFNRQREAAAWGVPVDLAFKHPLESMSALRLRVEREQERVRRLVPAASGWPPHAGLG